MPALIESPAPGDLPITPERVAWRDPHAEDLDLKRTIDTCRCDTRDYGKTYDHGRSPVKGVATGRLRAAATLRPRTLQASAEPRRRYSLQFEP